MKNYLDLTILYSLVSEEEYEAAIVLLRNIELENDISHSFNYHYLNALIYTQLGHITIARQHMSYIHQKSNDKQVILLKEKLKEIEPLYTLLVVKFNVAIDCIKEKDYNSADENLSEIFSKADVFSFPIQWYKTYFALKLYTGSEDLEEWSEQLPSHVKKNHSIRKMKGFLKMEKGELEATFAKKNKQPSWRMLYGTVVAAVIFASALVINFNWPEDGVQSTEVAKSSEITPSVSETALIEEFTGSAKQEDSSVYKVVYPTLTNETVKAFYVEGYQQYKSGNFLEAILNLEMVRRHEEKTYFTDDAHYFLLLSLTEVGRYNDSINESQYFIDEKDNNYKVSPYLEAVHLNIAMALIESGKTNEAKLVLKKMNTKNQRGWVFEEAHRMLREIENGN